jgi:competence protein ComEA
MLVSQDSLRDRLATLSRREMIGVCVVVALTLGGGALWYARSLPRPVQVAGAPGSAAPRAGPTAAPSAASIFVDVAGWVRRPGVYEFHDGDRIIDAIEAAGGERPGAALDALNLAALLADGTQVLVPKPVPSPVPPVTGTSPGTSIEKIDVNTADATALEELPGIGEVLAASIIDYRTQNGPFSSVDELEDVSGIGPATLEDIRDLVTV